jgi:HK97 family phage major capsid protein
MKQMNDAIVKLQRELAATKKDMETLHKDCGSNQLSSEQQTKWGQLLEKKNGIESALQREVDIHEADKALASIGGEEKELLEEQAKAAAPKKSPKLFNTLGEQVQAAAAALTGGPVDPRLLEVNAAITGAGTAPLQDGGFLIQTQFADQIWQNVAEVGQLAPRCMKLQIGAGFNAIEIIKIKDQSRADGARWGGVQVYRAVEAGTVDPTKIKFDKVRIESSKMMALAYFTKELLRDASAVESLTRQAITEEFSVVLDEEIFDGNGGNGKCLGFMNSGSKISISKEANQPANTIVPQNIVKMYARCFPRFRANAAWFYNVDIEPQLHLMTLPIGTAGVPVFLPPSGLVSAPNGMLYGKPLIPVETAETLGTEGDLVLADLSQYALVEKEGLSIAKSEHVRFLNDEVVFRFTKEVNGQPKYDEAITPKKGSNTLSAFVTLATRA